MSVPECSEGVKSLFRPAGVRLARIPALAYPLPQGTVLEDNDKIVIFGSFSALAVRGAETKPQTIRNNDCSKDYGDI